jgi:hypothetical protein
MQWAELSNQALGSAWMRSRHSLSKRQECAAQKRMSGLASAMSMMSCAWAQRSSFGDAAVDDEGHIPLAREIEKDFPFMREAFDVGLDDGALNFDAVKAVLHAAS